MDLIDNMCGEEKQVKWFFPGLFKQLIKTIIKENCSVSLTTSQDQ